MEQGNTVSGMFYTQANMHLHTCRHEIHTHVWELAAFYHSFPHYLSDLKPLLKETVRCNKQRKHTLYRLPLQGIKMVSKNHEYHKIKYCLPELEFRFYAVILSANCFPAP